MDGSAAPRTASMYDDSKGRLKAAKLIAPLNQGDLCDGLSGLYAILNALRLALALKRPLASVEVDAIFRIGMRFIELRGSLARCTHSGIRQELWRRLAEALLSCTEDRLGVRLFLEQPFRHSTSLGAEGALRFLEQMVTQQKATMMLLRGGRYTVVSGFTADSLLLFDSCGSRWVRRRCCGLIAEAPRVRHSFCPSSFITVCV